MTIRFETAQEADAGALAAVQKAAFDSQAPPEMPDLGGPPGYDEAAWQIAAMRESPYYKVLRDDEIVGGIVLRLPEPGHVHVERVFLHPAHHGNAANVQHLAPFRTPGVRVVRFGIGTDSKIADIYCSAVD